MALQNAFENLAVESKQDTIITGVNDINTELDNIKANQTNGTQITKIKQVVPTDSLNTNPEIQLNWSDGKLSSVYKTVNSVLYARTITYDEDGLPSIISPWFIPS